MIVCRLDKLYPEPEDNDWQVVVEVIVLQEVELYREGAFGRVIMMLTGVELRKGKDRLKVMGSVVNRVMGLWEIVGLFGGNWRVSVWDYLARREDEKVLNTIGRV